MSLQTSLESLGLSKTEITAYTALLQMGSGTVQEIVRKSGLKRTTTYGALDKLINKKLVVLIKKQGKQTYTAKDPNETLDLIKQEEQDFLNDQKEILKNLPKLSAVYSGKLKKPTVRFYEGRENMKQVFREILTLSKGSELLGYSGTRELAEGWWSDFARYFIEQRTKSGITDRSIMEDAPFSRNEQKQDKKYLRNTLLVEPDKYPLNGHIFIYGSHVMIASFKDQISLVIDNKHFADTQRSLCELARLGAQQVGKLSPNPYIKPKKKDGN